MKASKIRDALRQDHSEDMDRRRQLMLLSSLGIVDFSIISLLQAGVIRRLPNIPYRKMIDPKAVNTSKAAFKMGLPDAVVSNLLFSVKMAMATAGGSEKAGRKPVFDLLLGAVSLGHALGAAKMTYRMFFKQKKVCVYYLTGAALIVSSAAVIAPTVMSSAKKMLGS